MDERGFEPIEPAELPIVPIEEPEVAISQPPEVVAEEEERTEEANGEDFSDLFVVTTEDVLGDTEEGLEELTTVSEEDVMGEGDPSLADLVEVPREVITGYDYAPETPQPQRGVAPRAPRVIRRPPPTTMGGQQV